MRIGDDVRLNLKVRGFSGGKLLERYRNIDGREMAVVGLHNGHRVYLHIEDVTPLGSTNILLENPDDNLVRLARELGVKI